MMVGALAGWTVGYLTAPRSGKRTRKQLADEALEIKDALEEAANTKLEEAKTMLNKAMSKPTEKDEKVTT